MSASAGSRQISFTVDSDTQITAIVPAGAISGLVRVTTPDATLVAPGTLTIIARLVLNEIAPNIDGGHDLVELRATTAGTVAGTVLVENPDGGGTTLATLPALVVAVGDLIVVHLDPGAGVSTETTSTSDCADSDCYDDAYDVVGGDTGITYEDTVLELARPSGRVLDAGAFAIPGAPDTAGFDAQVAALIVAGVWSGDSEAGTAADWSAVGTQPTGDTIARAGADTNTSTDWAVGTETIGLPNS